jgi:hypothetical protein
VKEQWGRLSSAPGPEVCHLVVFEHVAKVRRLPANGSRYPNEVVVALGSNKEVLSPVDLSVVHLIELPWSLPNKANPLIPP